MNKKTTQSLDVEIQNAIKAQPLLKDLRPMIQVPLDQSSVEVYRGKGAMILGGNTFEGPMDVCLERIPRPSIKFRLYLRNFPVKEALGISLGSLNITSFPLDDREVSGFFSGMGGVCSDDKEAIVMWCPSSEPVLGIGDEASEIKRLTFHLLNFRDVLGSLHSTQKKGTATHAIQHIPLMWEGWHAEIKSLASSSEAVKMKTETGGLFLTHVVGVERSGEKMFSGEQATWFLTAFRFFLSFAHGNWCNPVCPVGADIAEGTVWSQLSSPQDFHRSRSSWFDPHSPDQLMALFPLFMQKWSHEDWKDALREIIYWYMIANSTSGGIDAGIILTQAAIERLAFEFAVKDKRLLTTQGFKDLRASDRFRILFSSLGIPLEIPPECKVLSACFKKNNWLDAPHALTEIRNSLVHPEHKKRGNFNEMFHAVWNLSLWYLEMSLLAICGYSGTYGNRLKQRWVGQVDPVPWGKQK